jgi:CRP-like cAMP-binding protein
MSKMIDPSRLRALSPLDQLKGPGFSALYDKIEVLKAKRGQTIFKKGENFPLSVYVLSGKVQLLDGAVKGDTIKGGSPEARFPLAPHLPRQYSAVALNSVEYLSIDSELLDLTVTWDQTGIYEVSDLTEEDPEQNNDWMSALLRIKAFQSIPPENIQSIFMRMQQVNHKAGDVVVRQNEQGDYFYFISDGNCRVTREVEGKPGGIALGELTFGDTFGEEALITDAKRNATVTMTTDGTLMRLSKENFQNLLSEPAVDRVDYSDAMDIIESGGKWLDVRLPNEFNAQHEDGAINLPLYLLRLKLNSLDAATPYVVCCGTGVRSSAAAFILNTKNFQAVVLKGGLNRNSTVALTLESPQALGQT